MLDEVSSETYCPGGVLVPGSKAPGDVVQGIGLLS